MAEPFSNTPDDFTDAEELRLPSPPPRSDATSTPPPDVNSHGFGNSVDVNLIRTNSTIYHVRETSDLLAAPDTLLPESCVRQQNLAKSAIFESKLTDIG